MIASRSEGAFTLLSRAGYAARGVVYLIVGALAVLAALGQGAGTPDTQDALTRLLLQPFGHVLLGLVALGLVGYALWRFVQALLDADGHGTDSHGLAVRAGLLVSAVTHTSLAILALSMAFGWGYGSGGGGGSTQHWTSWLLQQPFGRWLVALAGLAVIGAGLAHMIKGWSAKFEKDLQTGGGVMRCVSPVCRFGLIARGVVFVIIGGFLIVAAIEFSSAEARGFRGALEALQQQPYGWFLLAAVALGLMAFGVYGLIQAAYRRIDHPADGHGRIL